MKRKYHNDYGRPFVVKADLSGVQLIHDAILANLLSAVVILEKRCSEACGMPNMVDLDVCEDEPS